MIFTADGYFFKGKPLDSLARIADIIGQLPSVEKLVVVPYAQEKPNISAIPKAVMYADFQIGGGRG